MLAQYPSREAFDRNRGSTSLRQVLDGCDDSHVHGVQRSAWTNLAIPIGLGILRLRDLLLREDPILPFQPIPEEDALPQIQIQAQGHAAAGPRTAT